MKKKAKRVRKVPAPVVQLLDALHSCVSGGIEGLSRNITGLRTEVMTLHQTHREAHVNAQSFAHSMRDAIEKVNTLAAENALLRDALRRHRVKGFV